MTCITVGALGTNCYVMDDGRGGVVVVDPGADAAALLAAVGERPVSAVLVTHAHFDHVGAVDELARLCPAGWVLGARDRGGLEASLELGRHGFGVDARVASEPARLLEDGDVVAAGAVRLRAVACPGHTPGGMAYVDDAAGIVFTGDTLFCGSAGRTDLPGGNVRDLLASLAHLAQLPPETVVLPGHGGPTTISCERASNPYMRRGMRA